MSLYTTELRRLRKRRFVRYMTLLGLLILVAVAVGTFITNQKIGPEQLAAAERAADQQYQQQVQGVERAKKDCEQAKAAGISVSDRGFPSSCEDITGPSRESFKAEWFMPATFDFRTKFGYMITTFAAILALVGFVVGASFVGAEWNTGGMMNLLLWRPQRLKVLLTKLGALLSALFGLVVVGAAAWTGAFWAIANVRGSTAKMTSGTWQSFALMGLRGTTLVLVAALIGFGLASLGRHTAVALGGALGVVVVGQFGLGILLSMAQVKFVEAWLLPTYLLAWMQKKVTLQDFHSCEISYTGECNPNTFDITWQTSGILLAVGVVVTLGAAMWAIRRRDIT